MTLIVDGMNVIGTRPDGWWRDRAAARRRLVDDLIRLRAGGLAVAVVFDGRAAPGEIERADAVGLAVTFAPGGPNAADDAIVDMVGAMGAGGGTVVVTSDRDLARRVRQLGAQVESARAFLARLSGPT